MFKRTKLLLPNPPLQPPLSRTSEYGWPRKHHEHRHRHQETRGPPTGQHACRQARLPVCSMHAACLPGCPDYTRDCHTWSTLGMCAYITYALCANNQSQLPDKQSKPHMSKPSMTQCMTKSNHMHCVTTTRIAAHRVADLASGTQVPSLATFVGRKPRARHDLAPTPTAASPAWSPHSQAPYRNSGCAQERGQASACGSTSTRDRWAGEPNACTMSSTSPMLAQSKMPHTRRTHAQENGQDLSRCGIASTVEWSGPAHANNSTTNHPKRPHTALTFEQPCGVVLNLCWESWQSLVVRNVG